VRASRALAPVYRALALDYDPQATGSVEDEVGAIEVETVRDALLAEIAREREVLRVPLPDETLDGAARFEPSHSLAELRE
jgi:hypothetical protein